MTNFTFRTARPQDAHNLVRLAALDSAAPLTGDVLLAEARGRPVAALSLADGRAVADPFERSAPAVAALRAPPPRAPPPAPAPRALPGGGGPAPPPPRALLWGGGMGGPDPSGSLD